MAGPTFEQYLQTYRGDPDDAYDDYQDDRLEYNTPEISKVLSKIPSQSISLQEAMAADPNYQKKRKQDGASYSSFLQQQELKKMNAEVEWRAKKKAFLLEQQQKASAARSTTPQPGLVVSPDSMKILNEIYAVRKYGYNMQIPPSLNQAWASKQGELEQNYQRSLSGYSQPQQTQQIPQQQGMSALDLARQRSANRDAGISDLDAARQRSANRTNTSAIQQLGIGQ